MILKSQSSCRSFTYLFYCQHPTSYGIIIWLVIHLLCKHNDLQIQVVMFSRFLIWITAYRKFVRNSKSNQNFSYFCLLFCRFLMKTWGIYNILNFRFPIVFVILQILNFLRSKTIGPPLTGIMAKNASSREIFIIWSS